MEKRILLLVGLLSILAFAQTTSVSAQCDIVIEMVDSYGDGWNGASIKVYDGSNQIGTATIGTGGSAGTETISAPDMTDISLVWVSGEYDSECSFTVTNGIGVNVYVCELSGAPSAGEFFVFPNICSSVGLDLNLFKFLIPSRIAEGESEIKGIVRSERDTPITSFDAVYYIDDQASEVSTFDNLNIAFNESFEFTHSQLANIVVGEHNLELKIENINNQGDDDVTNNNLQAAQVLCVNEIFVKNVVYEEGTGTWCGWCPRGLVGLNTMGHNYTDGTWIGIGVHNGDPMKVTEYDQGVGTFISGYPSGVMNRETVFDPGISTLVPAYLASKAEIPLAKIEMSAKTWDAGTREITVEATSNFAMDLTGTSYNLSMVIVESGITGTGSDWNQANSYSGGGSGDLIDWDGTNWANLANPVPAADMVYNHVGRVLVGGWDGISDIIPANVVYGTPYSHEFIYTLDDEFDPNEITLVVMLHNATTGIIENAYELPLEADVLTADFSADVVEGIAPLEVNFTDETQGGNITAWSWDFDNDGVEDSNEQNPSFTFETGGSYSVRLTVTNETENTFTQMMMNFIHAGTVGLDEILESNFKCYPNPAQDVINIQSVANLNSIKLYNVSGQVVYSNDRNASKLHTIDISSFDNGVYFMELSTEAETKTIKIVIE